MSQPRVVEDIMTRDPIVLREEDDLWSAQEDMQNLGMHHIPIVDGDQLVGLVTQKDMIQAAASSLHRDSIHGSLDRSDRHSTFLAAIMHRDAPTVRPDTPLREAARKLRQSEYECLMVTDADGTLRGLLTAHDFIDLLVELLPE
jgi:CBS domain-containing protein